VIQDIALKKYKIPSFLLSSGLIMIKNTIKSKLKIDIFEKDIEVFAKKCR